MKKPSIAAEFFNGFFALGLFIGVAGTILFILTLDTIGGEWWNDFGFTGTIIGAVLGGGIAIIGQLLVILENKSKYINEKKDIQTQLLLTLLQSVSDIGSSLKSLKAHLNESRSDAVNTGVPLPVATIPLATKLTRKFLEKEEKVNLLSLRLADIYNRVSVLDARHNAHVDTIERFELDREKLMEIVNLESRGGAIRLNYAVGKEAEANGRIEVMNLHFNQLDKYVSEDASEIDDLLEILANEISKMTDINLNYSPNVANSERI